MPRNHTATWGSILDDLQEQTASTSAIVADLMTGNDVARVPATSTIGAELDTPLDPQSMTAAERHRAALLLAEMHETEALIAGLLDGLQDELNRVERQLQSASSRRVADDHRGSFEAHA